MVAGALRIRPDRRSNERFGDRSGRQVRGSRGRRRRTSRTSKQTSGTSAGAATPAATGHRRFGVSTSETPMAGSARSACRLCRTRLLRMRSPLHSAVYEADFIGFSYGFRPGRNPHMALSALSTALMRRRVEWLLRMVAHRIADPRILRLIRQWLRVAILEAMSGTRPTGETPQRARISPLLANIFLHYVLDLWVHQ